MVNAHMPLYHGFTYFFILSWSSKMHGTRYICCAVSKMMQIKILIITTVTISLSSKFGLHNLQSAVSTALLNRLIIIDVFTDR